MQPKHAAPVFTVCVALPTSTRTHTQWAYSCEARLGTHPSAASAHALAPPSPRTQHFPLLRAAADLLMMPKDLLLDEAVRKDVSAALTPRCARGLHT